MAFPWTNFAEIPLKVLMFGETLRASTLSQVNKNTQEAVLTPEFFGPTNYSDGNTVSLPVSSIDGYTYARAELFYIWEWRRQDADSTGQHYRIPGFYATVDTNGLVHIQVWRLKLGGPYITEPDAGDAVLQIRVVTVGIRGRQNPAVSLATVNNPGDSSTSTSDDDGSATGINTQPGTTYTFALNDNGALVRFTSSSAITATVPTNANVNFPIGASIQVRQVGTGTLTVVGDTGVTVNATVATFIQNQTRVLTKVGTNEWDLA